MFNSNQVLGVLKKEEIFPNSKELKGAMAAVLRMEPHEMRGVFCVFIFSFSFNFGVV